MTQAKAMTLTEADLEAIAGMVSCKITCPFTNEEVLFVRDWLDTAKTAKSEVIKVFIKGVIIVLGVAAFLTLAFKMGWQDRIK